MFQGEILFAQLEIWKAAHSEEDLGMQWLPDTTSSNASSGDVSEGKIKYTYTYIILKIDFFKFFIQTLNV